MTLISGSAATTVLAGSDLDMDGLLNVIGDVRTAARLNIRGTAQVLTPGEPLRLDGGSLANPNQLLGGTISGNGFLVASSDRALHGFGTIATDVEFNGSAELKARDGLLSVTGTVTDMGEIGTSDVDGILNMANPWNTNVANSVRLAGGELRGGTITNDGVQGIRGHGLLTATINNNTGLYADGGILIVNNGSSDYDGTGAGVLDATSGDLEIRDNVTFGFGGTARVGNARQASIEGFRLNFNSGSKLELTAGTWTAPVGLNLAGTVAENGGGASRISSDADLTFVGGSNTTLVGNLQVSANPTVVQAGATLTGGGDLVNLGARSLRLNNGAVLGVGIQNQALLELGNTATVRADAADFIQTATGTLSLDLAGTGINQFDRLVLTGAAQLQGELAVSLLGGFSPSLGNAFTVLTAAGGVSGTFDVESLPTLGSGLVFDVMYNPTSVLLQVVQNLPPDFDMDGDVDGSDVDLLVMEITAMTNGSLFDLTGDALVNTSDLTEWLDQAGAINLASGNPYFPGDANLDGSVDGSDFNIWNGNWSEAGTAWYSSPSIRD